MTYCTDLCGFWEEGASLTAFIVPMPTAIVASKDSHCTEYLCEETETPTESYNPTDMCFPEPTFRASAISRRLSLGRILQPRGLCVWDDRAGCESCQLCSSDEACGVRGICWGKTRKYEGICTVLCAPPNYTCPGNSMCREIIQEGESHFLCLSPQPAETPELTQAIIRSLPVKPATRRDPAPFGTTPPTTNLAARSRLSKHQLRAPRPKPF